MSDTETYSLSWNAFKNHLQLILRELYEEEKNSDLTLITDDLTQFKAHKFVLSAGSSALKRIIENNLSQHPVIYLRGIESYEIESILQFVYLGEANVSSERLEEFLRVSADLGVKGISETLDETDKHVVAQSGKENINRDPGKHDGTADCMAENTIANTNTKADTGDIDIEGENGAESQVIKNQRSLELVEPIKVSEDFRLSESVEMPILKEALSKETVVDDKEEEYLELNEVLCSNNSTVFQKSQDDCTSTEVLNSEDVKYPFNEGDYQTTQKSSLQNHIQSIPGGIKYPCNQCDYQAT